MLDVDVASAIGEQLDGLMQWLRELWCWLCYGHIWYDVGIVGPNIMLVQCRHCAMTRHVNVLTGIIG